MSLYKYIIKRILTSLITVFGILIITYVITRALPGDPAMNRMYAASTYEDYLAERARLGLDEPIYVQFLIFIKDMLTGNWGYSYLLVKDSQVWDIINQKLPRSLEIMFISMAIAIALGLLLGKVAGAHKNSKKDTAI